MTFCSVLEWVTTGDQQKWDSWEPERMLLSRVGDELSEGPIVASSAFDGLGLYLLPAQIRSTSRSNRARKAARALEVVTLGSRFA